MQKTSIKIQGDRIYLREIELGDVNQKYVNWLIDPEVNKYLETRHKIQTIETVYEYVKQMIAKKDELLFSICFKKNDNHIGNIKLGPINLNHKYAEISLLIGEKNEWGKNLATEAIQILSTYAINILKLHKLTAGSYANNIGSIKSFEKAGFIIDGTWKNHYLCDGEYVDRICFSLINDEI
tara:strand:+ start:2586 stop:3128 length:543 start_codon:yes stop_codon:yes gene_type:complete